MHNVTVRQRALKRGYTLSEYALARVEDGSFVAGATEEEIYAALGLDWIPPELRENNGEIEAAEEHRLPVLIDESDIRGDVHMHTMETDGKNTIREMAEAGMARGYGYIAITDHSKNLAMTNGLDDAAGAGAYSSEFARWIGRWRERFGCLPGLRWTFWRMGRWICRTRCWRRWTW